MILSNSYKKRKKEKQRKLKIQTAKKILIGTVAGSLGGLVGGLLFSPKSGKETREDIVNTSKEFTNNVKEKTIELKETLDDKVTDTKDSVTEAKMKISQYLSKKKTSKVICETKDNVTDNEDLTSIVGQSDTLENEIKSSSSKL